MENHVADGGAASVRTILPTGVGENGEIGIWDSAMVKAEEKDGIRSAVRIELKSVVGAATKVANKPGEMHAFASLQTAKRRLARPCVVGKVEKSTHSRAEGEAPVFLFDKIKIRSGDWVIVFAESVVKRKGGIALREFGT